MNLHPIDRRAAAFARRKTLLWAGGAVLGGALLATSILACGPWFPNRFLDGGDEAVLAAPHVDFRGQLQRLKLIPSDTASDATDDPPPPKTPAGSSIDDTLEAELADLRAALAKSGKFSASERDAVVARHSCERAKLAEEHRVSRNRYGFASAADKAPPKTIVVQAELPLEFAEYFHGAIAWKRDETNAAISAWTRVLGLPASERRYKSTWTAYMLGKAYLDDDAAKAVDYFRQVRAFAKEGFPDRLDLATSSLGWEARAYLRLQKSYEAATLYIEQGEQTGCIDENSIRWTVSGALYHGEDLERFAAHLKLRRVVTASLLGDLWWTGSQQGIAGGWLEAVEAAGVKDMESAEELALVAYHAGEFEQARRWMKLASNSAVTQWLQAKLLLRDGKLSEAAALLSKVARRFPILDKSDEGAPRKELKDLIYFDRGDLTGSRESARHLRGELGTVRLARRDYVASLDAFMQAESWDDAAFVAERVLTLGELKAYVDAHHPDPALDGSGEKTSRSDSETVQLRSLLARRLTREMHGHEANEYFPPGLRAAHATLILAVNVAWDESQPKAARAEAFVKAGRIARHQGMELIGTELAPDFAIHGGDFENGVTPESRWQGSQGEIARPNADAGVARVLVPSPDERRRTAVEPADPPERFHYRYIAADLMWRGAQLMQDDTDEKARVLCEAGSWLKGRDPLAADRYYKELVRKCGQTTIGKLADEVRWFPWLDDRGNLLPDQPRSRKVVKWTEEVPAEFLPGGSPETALPLPPF